jgi:hypothetical protein
MKSVAVADDPNEVFDLVVVIVLGRFPGGWYKRTVR